MRLVAVAVNGSLDDCKVRGGKGSLRALKWAVANLTDQADGLVLIHVMPRITSIPTPSGELIPISKVDANVLAEYVYDVKMKFEEIFKPFKKACDHRTIETLLLEDDDPASSLLRYISEAGIQMLVMGSNSSNFITRKLKGPGVPTTVLRCAPSTCDIYIVGRDGIISKLAESATCYDTISRYSISTERSHGDNLTDAESQISALDSYSAEPQILGKSQMSSSAPDFSHIDSKSSLDMYLLSNASLDLEITRDFAENEIDVISIDRCSSLASKKSEQSVTQEEVAQLQLELQNSIAMYRRICKELAHDQNKVLQLSSECLEEVNRVKAATEREATLRSIAAEEKAKRVEAMKELEEAKKLLSKETYERQIAELNALKEFIEKQRIVDELFSHDRRYRKYSRDEIEVATNYFSEANMIGEGGYGKVYRCILDHTPVAVKVVRQDAMEKREEFLKEVEILSQLHHPHLVLLLGACPDIGCLVYEYLENGSLEDYILHRNGKQLLPWFIRFRIVFQVACGLSFLHNTKPEAIVHRDLKPGNILLDKNYVSKLSDVGLAKLLADVAPDNITEYSDTLVAGTVYYMDPEYQRTGTIRPKSDIYALGIVALQLLTARRPHGLILVVENALRNGTLPDILDRSINWPLAQTLEMAQIALRCSQLRCRDRPDLDTEVLPVLKRLFDTEKADVKLHNNSINMQTPSQYYCPILQEIMDDPYIAADGFTYEYRAIKTWLGKHNVSPVTKCRLQHSTLTQNHTLRIAIQEWKSHLHSSSSRSAKDELKNE